MNRYLQAGTHVKRPGHSDKYEIKDIVGAGASCAVYYAELVDTSSVRTEHLLKEYNPRGLKLERDKTGCLHICSERDAMAFESGLIRFKTGYEMQLNVRCCSDVKNSTSNIQGVFEANGTCYIDMTVMAGKTYEKVKEKTLYDLLRRIEAITKIVGSYHENGLLHLDIKPDNIFTLPETVELVQMFDFDSVIKKTDVNKSVFLSCTQSWAAQEQILPNRRNRICEATDIFAIGEMLFYKLMGRHSEPHERRSFALFSFDYSKELFEGVNPRVFPLLSEILRHTICNVTTNRYQTTAAFLEKLKEAIALSDSHKPFLQHHLPPKAAYFVGRDAELRQIDERFAYTDKLFISGVGGIGKSELARQYAHAHKDEYDAVIFSVCNTDLESMILDDSMLPVSNVRQWPDEKARDYCNRKLRELKQLCNKRVLIIVDNFNDMQDNLLNKLLKMDCRLLFTTRCDVSGWNYEQLCLGSLDEEYVWDIFRTWYRSPLDNADHTAVEQILNLYQGHTMAVELIAKQMRASCVTPRQMLDKLNAGGFGDSGRERVAHAKDGINAKRNIHDHIRRLFDASDLGEDKVYILANLSLIPPSGIDKRRFHDWCKLDSFEDINDLVESGWVKHDEVNDRIYIHPVIADIMFDKLKEQFDLCNTMISTITWFLGQERPDNEPDSLYGEMTSTRYEKLVPIVINMLKKICRFEKLSVMGINYIIAAASHLYEFGSVELYILFLEKAFAIYTKSPNQDVRILIKLYNTRGILSSANCDYQLAEKSYKEALKLAVEHYGELDEKTIKVRNNIIVTYLEWEKNDELEYYYAQMRCAYVNELQGKISASAYGNMGLVAKKLGFFEDAEFFYQKSLWQCINDHGINHGLTGLAHLNLGALYLTQDKFEKAEEHLDQARLTLLEYYGEKNSLTATAYAQSGTLSLNQGRYTSAEACYQKALRIRKELFGNRHIDTANSCNDLGTLYYKMNKLDKAQKYFAEALSIRRLLSGINHISTSSLLLNIGSLWMELGNLDEAEANYLEAERIAQVHYGAHAVHPDVATIKNALGRLCKEKRDYDSAIRYCSEALRIWQQVYGDEHSHTAIAHLNLGVYYRESNRYDEAIRELNEALGIYKLVHGNDNCLDAGSVYSALGKTYAEIGEEELAEANYNKALKIRLAFLEPDHPNVQLIYQRIQELRGKKN